MMNIFNYVALAFASFAMTCPTFGEPPAVALPPLPEQEANQPAWLLQAAQTLPHPRQVAWQDMALTCFVCIGPNTFTGVEWGTGKESPTIFNPSGLDCEQWVLAAKSAGMKLMLLTAKHHDGFCLWQTRYTEHSVASSPWRDGQGDVLREMVQACAKHGMKVGVYLSPADLYQIESSEGLYGNGSAKTTRTIPTPVQDRPFPEGHKRFTFDEIDDYNAYMLNQLYEVLTEYGPVHEVWFDGAHPKRKGNQTYNYPAWYSLIRALAPEAVIAVKGPDVRWIGNEAGYSRDQEYSVIPFSVGSGEMLMSETANDLGSRSALKHAYDQGATFRWYPSEMDTSIREGWFYHAREDGHPKGSLQRLVQVYFDGPGSNSVLLLSLPPDKRGLFHESDVASLKQFGDYINQTFKQDHARDATVQTSSALSGHPAEQLVDGDANTYWRMAEGHNRGWIQLDLGKNKTFDVIDLREHIQSSGQRIESFYAEALIEGVWAKIGQGGTVGHRKALRIDEVSARHIRIHITSARGNASLQHIGLYDRPLLLLQPEIKRDRNGLVTISAAPGSKLYYTTDGSVPTTQSKTYESPFEFKGKGVIRAIAANPDKADLQTQPTTMPVDIAPTLWSVHAVSSDQPDAGEQASHAIDGDPNTIWHSQWRPEQLPHPHTITIDFGQTLLLEGFTYLPRLEAHKAGCILKYKLEVSSDGNTWDTASQGNFDNMANNPTYREVRFKEARSARYMRLTSLQELNDLPFASAAEIGVITGEVKQ